MRDLVGLYLSAILYIFCTETCVLTFVLCRVAADGPSITFELASTSACALQTAAHCIKPRMNGMASNKPVLSYFQTVKINLTYWIA